MLHKEQKMGNIVLCFPVCTTSKKTVASVHNKLWDLGSLDHDCITVVLTCLTVVPSPLVGTEAEIVEPTLRDNTRRVVLTGV